MSAATLTIHTAEDFAPAGEALRNQLPADRHIVVTPGGREFALCVPCGHWTERHHVDKCECCTRHRERPTVVLTLVEEEDDENRNQ